MPNKPKENVESTTELTLSGDALQDFLEKHASEHEKVKPSKNKELDDDKELSDEDDDDDEMDEDQDLDDDEEEDDKPIPIKEPPIRRASRG